MPFVGITTEIPTSNLEDFATPGTVEFSNRGSMLIRGRRVKEREQEAKDNTEPHRQVRKSSITMLSVSKIPSRMLSTDDEVLSQKVRSLYENISDLETKPVVKNLTGTDGVPAEIKNYDTATVPPASPPRPPPLANSNVLVQASGSTQSIASTSFIGTKERELAGGIEDWHDIRQ